MFVVFVVPFLRGDVELFLQAMLNFGVRLAIITQDPREQLSAPLQRIGHWKVQNSTDTEELIWAARGLVQQFGPIKRIFSYNEQVQVPVAEVRARLDIEGMLPDVVLNFRDKARMKERLRSFGLPCARSVAAVSPEQVWDFVKLVGFPICVKPVDGAASQSTYRVEQAEDLSALLQMNAPSWGHPLQVEEFVTGQEHSFETASVGGKHLWHSLTRYHPTPLDVMRNPWIQWRMVVPREIDDAQYDDIRQIGERALDVLGMETGFSHMEWFRRKDGTIAIGEVGCRPPGSQIFTSMNWANDFDLYTEWCRLMIFDQFQPPSSRKYAVGTAFVRGLGGGYVKSVHGWDYVCKQLGTMLVEWKQPQPGQSAGITYEGEGYIMVRHPSTSAVEEALELIVNNVRVELSR
jgi:phosphoribosylaminoimidazole carboxylase (NCAIR synthetase)